MYDTEATRQSRQRLHTALDHLRRLAPVEGAPTSPTDLYTPECPYILALTDVMSCLGATASEAGGQISLRSAQVGYFLEQVMAFLSLGVPVVENWTHEGVSSFKPTPFTAVDLSAALERRRLALDPAAKPIRQLSAAIGLIKGRGVGANPYLAAWDEAARAWQLIGGRIETTDPTPDSAMAREIAEELSCAPLIEGRDVALMPLGRPFTRERVSPTYGILSQVIFHAFYVRFLGGTPHIDTSLRWVTFEELEANRTADDQPVAGGPFRQLLQEVGTELVTALPESF